MLASAHYSGRVHITVRPTPAHHGRLRTGSSGRRREPRGSADGSHHVVPMFVRAAPPCNRDLSGVKGSGECGRRSGGRRGGGGAEGRGYRARAENPARDRSGRACALLSFDQTSDRRSRRPTLLLSSPAERTEGQFAHQRSTSGWESSNSNQELRGTQAAADNCSRPEN